MNGLKRFLVSKYRVNETLSVSSREIPSENKDQPRRKALEPKVEGKDFYVRYAFFYTVMVSLLLRACYPRKWRAIAFFWNFIKK